MITTQRYIYGIKKNNESIESNIEKIIDNAQEYLVMGSYSFWMPKHIFYKLKNITPHVSSALIFPHVNRSGDVINSEKTIRNLINANIGVIISGTNHSKFIFNEKSLYYGSANLTNSGLNLNIEAVTLYESLRADLKSDFKNFVLEEIEVFLSNNQLGIQNINANILKNFNALYDMVYKLNPNILKVEKTVNNYEDCDRIIGKAIDGYYATLSFMEFNKTYRKLLVLRRNLEQLYKYGTFILYTEGFLEKENPEDIKVDPVKINKYNELVGNFNYQLMETLNLLENIPFNSRIGWKNDELATKNFELLTKLKNKLIEELESEIKDDKEDDRLE